MRLSNRLIMVAAFLLAGLVAISSHTCTGHQQKESSSPAPQAISSPAINPLPAATKPDLLPSPSSVSSNTPLPAPELIATPSPAVNLSFKPNPEEGKKLFYAIGCIGCHTAEGIGGNVGPNLSDIGARRDEAYIEKSIREPKAYIVPGYPPIMPSPQELGLKEEDIAHLIAWLRTLK